MVDEIKIKETREFLDTLPEIEFCVGYGSGFSEQLWSDKSKNQRDLLIGVKNTSEFYKKNLLNNSNNYSTTEKAYYKNLALLHNIGTEINFSPYHKFGNSEYKIGVFNTGYLEKELIINKDGYLPGRLAKNIVEIKVNDRHKKLIDYNKKCTIITALLLLDNQVKTEELLKTIIGLSYRGDFRKYLGLESDDKVDRILNGAYHEYKELYTDNELYRTDCFGRIIKNKNLNEYIDTLQQDMLDYLNKNDYKNRNNENRKAIIEKYLFQKNFFVTPLQGVKGIISVGPKKLVRYKNDKISKK